MIDTKELRRLAEAATPGPWNLEDRDGDNPPSYIFAERTTGYDVDDEPHNTVCRVHVAEMPSNAYGYECLMYDDAPFITAANPAAVIALLDRLDKAAAVVERKDRELSAQHQRLVSLEAKVKEKDADIAGLRRRLVALTDEAVQSHERPGGGRYRFKNGTTSAEIAAWSGAPAAGEQRRD